MQGSPSLSSRSIAQTQNLRDSTSYILSWSMTFLCHYIQGRAAPEGIEAFVLRSAVRLRLQSRPPVAKRVWVGC